MNTKQPEKTRMDRVEKGLELLLKGTLELKESQKKTDAQLQKTDELLEKTIRKLDEIGRQLGDLGLPRSMLAAPSYCAMVQDLVPLPSTY